ncbi:hypothetical protein BH160DRAFT_6930 [Burkholderia sp. H160]|nr:hypothetical protein BH160DRAFT_6930 [Burkholderia sp. H160]
MDNVAADQQGECVPPAEAVREDGRVIDLSLAGKGNYQARRSAVIEPVWFVLEACVINNKLLPLSFVRVGLLRLLGAKIGTGCRFVHRSLEAEGVYGGNPCRFIRKRFVSAGYRQG